MSKYRPGYIEGKVKLGVYVDEDVRKALRIRAAETGENMSDIAERALRRELGMMTRQTLATIKARAAQVDSYTLNEAAKWLDEQFGESILVEEAQPWELVLWIDRYYPGGWREFLRGI